MNSFVCNAKYRECGSRQSLHVGVLFLQNLQLRFITISDGTATVAQSNCISDSVTNLLLSNPLSSLHQSADGVVSLD
jgi:hypothetical protein